MKTIILLSCLSAAFISFSQDTIQLKNGNFIEAKVTEISERKMSYKRFDNLENGPTYTINLFTVSAIKFENGTVDNFDEVRQENANLTKRHLIQFNVADMVFDRAGFSYELFLDKKRNYSLFFPLRVTFNQKAQQWYSPPWYEGGIGGRYYLWRKGFMNISASLESNYAYGRNEIFIQHDGFWESQTVDRHWLGFYGGLDWKVNFKPRLGMNLGFSVGRRFLVNTNRSETQGKFDLGVFFRL